MTSDDAGRVDGGTISTTRATAIVLRDQKASTSYLQRRLAIGYNRAADLIERMEREGLISSGQQRRQALRAERSSKVGARDQAAPCRTAGVRHRCACSARVIPSRLPTSRLNVAK